MPPLTARTFAVLTTVPLTVLGLTTFASPALANGIGQEYTPGNPLPETWVSDNGNTHTFYAAWRTS